MTQDELLRLIDEAAADRRTTLDLSGQGLNELPPEIGKLTNLKTLVLGRWAQKNRKQVGNNLKTLPDEIGQLTELRSLLLAYNQFEKLPEVIGTLRELRAIDLDGNYLHSLPKVTSSLLKLRILYVGDNRFKELPEVVNYLPNLERIYLYENQLTEVPEFISELSSLTTLDIGNNQITKISECISRLTNLTGIFLGGNQITELPHYVGRLTNLKRLDLSNNQLSGMPECISRLTNLVRLFLGGNQILELPNHVGKLVNLKSLDLSNNQLSNVPKCIENLTKLLTLSLSKNQFSQIPECIGDLTNLDRLYAWRNQLTEVPIFIRNLTNLTILDFSSNQLSKMPECIGELDNLSELNLGNNQFSEIPECIGNLTNLTKLYIWGNRLTEIPIFIGELANLAILNFSSNQLSQIPECIGRLDNLGELNLGNNQLSEIPECIRNLTNLTKLYIWRNQLTEIPVLVGGLVNLAILDFSSNQLSQIPECIGKLNSLSELNLGNNQLSEVPRYIENLTNLSKLSLWGNQIAEIPAFISELTNLTVLDFSSNQLSEIPKCISKLNNLSELNLGNNQLSEVPRYIENLTNLSKLNFWGNQIAEIPKLLDKLTNLTELNISGNQLTKASNLICNLTNLITLNLSSNQLVEIPDFIGNLTNLTTLYLSSNQLVEVPDFVGNLTNLTTLNLGRNQLTKVPDSIGKLVHLTKLYLWENQLTEVPVFLSNLINIRELHLWGNKLFELPDFLQSLSNIEKLDVRANQLPISPELLGSKRRSETPTTPSNLFRLYFQAPEESEGTPLYEAKLLIVGEGDTGKTTLTNKLLNANYELDKEEKSTEGIEVSDFKFNHASGYPCRVNTWDFGGQEIYHATHQFFLTERSVYALVVDSRRENPNFYFWLNVIQLHGGDHSPIIVIKNEKQDRPCNINDLQLRGQFKNLKESVETNLATNRGLDSVKTTIENYISNLPGLGGNFPKSWTQIRNALENLTLGSEFYIDIKEYRDICCRYGIPDRTEQNDLSRTLHNLGIFLHFQDIHTLNKTLFLKPSWCTAAVYKVLDTDAVRKDCGRFNKGDLDKIWSDDQYSDVRSELLALMKEFEVCYEINGYKDHFIAPHLLSPNLPEEDSYAWDEQDNLILTYRYAFKPKNIFPRFIVALHKYIEGQRVVWKHGVVLSILSARAEVIEDVGYERSSIRIRVSGTDKKRLIAVIQDHIDRIHDSFERLQVEVLVPCNCSECKNSQTPYTFPHKTLLKSIEKKNYEVQCLYSFELVKVRRLIDEVFEPKSMFEKEQFFEEAKVIRPKMQGTRPGDGHPNDRADMYAASSDIIPDVSEAFSNKVAITVNLPEQRYQRSETTNVSGNTITNTTHQYGKGDNIAGDKIGRDKIGTQINNSQASTASNSSPNPSAPHIFISYARKDGTLAAERLHKEMVSAGCSVWRDIESMQGGRVWKNQLREAIRKADAVLVLLTPEAVASKFVEWEWETAETLDKTIIPVLIQACDIPEEWQVLHYRNLSTESIYSKGLSSIIGDLRE